MIDYLVIGICLIAMVGFFIQSYRVRQVTAEMLKEKQRWRLRFETELVQAGEERDRLLNALRDAFLLVTAEGNISFANVVAKDLFSGRKLIGRSVREAFLDERLTEVLIQCLKTREPVQKRVVISQQASPRGDSENRGNTAWIIDAAPPLSSLPGGSSDMGVVIRDVTSEYQLEQIRKDFVANASHELRTPLAIISGYLENLLDDGVLEDTEMSTHFLTIMRKHSNRISRIVEDMLMISKLESGETSAIKVKFFSVIPCLNDVIERLEPMISNQKAKVVISLHDPKLKIPGDHFYWTQVIFNLVENALKQNPNRDITVEIGSEEIENRVNIWVADNGIGIPAADLPHVFRRFYRVEKHHTQSGIKGTGLGLSIVKRAIEAHQGTISVTSTPGRETKFTMSLPLGNNSE